MKRFFLTVFCSISLLVFCGCTLKFKATDLEYEGEAVKTFELLEMDIAKDVSQETS